MWERKKSMRIARCEKERKKRMKKKPKETESMHIPIYERKTTKEKKSN